MTLWDDFVGMLSAVIDFVVTSIELVIVVIFAIVVVTVLVTLMIFEMIQQLSDRIFYNIPMTIKDDIREYFEELKDVVECTGLF